MHILSYTGFVFHVALVMTPSLDKHRSIIFNLNSILCHTSVALTIGTVPPYHRFMFRVTLMLHVAMIMTSSVNMHRLIVLFWHI